MAEYCIKATMAHYEGGYGCVDFTRYTLSGVEKDRQCYWVPKKNVVLDEQEFCGDDVEEVRKSAEDFKDKVYNVDGWHVRTERYLKFSDGAKREIKDAPFSLCAFLWGEENCWYPSRELRTFSDDNSWCSERYVMGFMELSKEWVCGPKND